MGAPTPWPIACILWVKLIVGTCTLLVHYVQHTVNEFSHYCSLLGSRKQDWNRIIQLQVNNYTNYLCIHRHKLHHKVVTMQLALSHLSLLSHNLLLHRASNQKQRAFLHHLADSSLALDMQHASIQDTQSLPQLPSDLGNLHFKFKVWIILWGIEHVKIKWSGHLFIDQ